MKQFNIIIMIVALMTFLAWYCGNSAKNAQKSTDKNKNALVNSSTSAKKALIIIASNKFRDEEFLRPYKLLTKNDINVTIASSKLGASIGLLGYKVEPQKTLSQVSAKDYDVIIFVGGTGAKEYFDNPKAHKIAKDAVKHNKILAAICIAPSILANSGLLKGVKATCYKSEAKNLKKKKATYTGKNVEVDGKIITANGPRASREFGKKILNALKLQ